MGQLPVQREEQQEAWDIHLASGLEVQSVVDARCGVQISERLGRELRGFDAPMRFDTLAAYIEEREAAASAA